jgi:1-acyl-sn-glycerol-3-phosphate acyltransferase
VFARWCWRVSFQLCGGLTVEGVEHVPCRGPVILAPNHVSLADPWIVMAASPNPMRSLAADELFRVPVLHSYLHALGCLRLRRGTADHQTMGAARRLLERGATVLIFPEGGCSPDGEPRPWLPGVAMLALRSGAPVIPVLISGSRRLLPLGTFWPRRQRVTARFLPPVQPPPLENGVPMRVQLERFRAQLEATWQAAYKLSSGQVVGAAIPQET